MDRENRRDNAPRRDTRDQKPRYDRNRSRSPQKERRDERRRDRSPFKGAGRGGGPSGPRFNNNNRDRDSQAPQRGPGGRPPPRQPHDSRANGPGQRGAQQAKPVVPEVKMELLEDEDEEAMMKRIMGFKGFRSTKDTKVPGNDKNYAVNKVKKSEYRQYMNRVGGFNRPLSPSRM